MPPQREPTRWEKTLSFGKKSYSFGKKGFDKAWDAMDKLGGPVNRLSNKVGCEAFWPMTLDKESDKAARILRSFCKDGFYGNVEDRKYGNDEGPKAKQRVLKKIPTEVIKNAKGLCIFTTMRTGLWVSGSGGSGVLLARIPETGEWSPPSGILLHTAGIGFLAGVDIYDCVIVINNYEALKAFKLFRCTLGGEISAAAGPVGVGGVLDTEVHKRQQPIWTYMKSRGLYAGAQVDGTIIVERVDENERFYNGRYSVDEILAGKIRHPPFEVRPLLQTVKAAQGDSDVDENAIPSPGQTPGDMQVLPPGSATFGIPAVDDPDPYGVKALEAEGFFIREAGSKERPSQDAFEFKPAVNSSVYGSSRDSWRGSVTSHISHTSTDRGVQTDEKSIAAVTSSAKGSPRSILEASPLNKADGNLEAISSEKGHDQKSNDEDNDEFYDVEVHDASSTAVSTQNAAETSVHVEPQTTAPESGSQSPTFTRAKLVTIPKRGPPPPLPPRNPQRPASASMASQPTSPVSPASPLLETSEPLALGSKLSEEDHRASMDGFTEVSLTNDAAKTDAVAEDTPAVHEEPHVESTRLSIASEKKEVDVAHEELHVAPTRLSISSEKEVKVAHEEPHVEPARLSISSEKKEEVEVAQEEAHSTARLSVYSEKEELHTVQPIPHAPESSKSSEQEKELKPDDHEELAKDHSETAVAI